MSTPFQAALPQRAKSANEIQLLTRHDRQPCNPNMVEARDAILDADEALTGGANACEIWTGFAKRGLGENAKYAVLRRTEDYVIPSGVC